MPPLLLLLVVVLVCKVSPSSFPPRQVSVSTVQMLFSHYVLYFFVRFVVMCFLYSSALHYFCELAKIYIPVPSFTVISRVFFFGNCNDVQGEITPGIDTTGYTCMYSLTQKFIHSSIQLRRTLGFIDIGFFNIGGTNF